MRSRQAVCTPAVLVRVVVRVLVTASALVAGVVWYAAGRGSLTSDESGFLMVAAQWHPGRSLYGDYWVDRPPGLIALFALAHVAGSVLGDAVALRLLGSVAAAVSVLLTWGLARSRLAVVATTALVVTPLFDAGEVNGEILALPAVLAGTWAVVTAARSASSGARPRRVLALAAAGGMAGAAAALVKQNFVDVLVVSVVVSLMTLRAGRGARGTGPAARLAATWLAGLVTVAAAVALAATRGTRPVPLFEAVVVFRLHASSVIGQEANGATSARLSGLLTALVLSGLPLLVLALVVRLRHGSRDGGPDLRWPALALLAWEAFGVLGGGSYWRHYLLGLVPGVVLLAAAARQRRPRTGVRTVQVTRLVAAGAVAVVVVSSMAHLVPALVARPPARADVVAWLVGHRRAHDSGVVAFGRPDILRASGLTSPYPELWSLPVRVEDPHLHRLAHVLAGPGRPTWVVLDGRTTLSGWGLTRQGRAQRTLLAHYRPVHSDSDCVVYLARGVHRPRRA